MNQIFWWQQPEQSKYKDKEGVEKLSVDVIANTIQFLGGKGDGGERPAPQPAASGGGAIDDDLPFRQAGEGVWW